METNRYIGLFDILGFKQLVQFNQLERLADAFTIFRRKVHACALVPHIWGEASLISHVVFSDTILVYSHDDSPTALDQIFVFCQTLIAMLFDSGLPIRGALTTGSTFIRDDIFIGAPIVQAYQMEQTQEWVGCWVQDACLRSLSPESPILTRRFVVRYDIPTKSGVAADAWAINWSPLVLLRGGPTDVDRELRSRFFEGFPSETASRAAPPDVERKIQNTISFLKAMWLHSTQTKVAECA